MKKTITILSMAMMAGMPAMAAPTSAASLARMNPEPLTERYGESQPRQCFPRISHSGQQASSAIPTLRLWKTIH